MEQRNLKKREPAPAGQVEQLLASHYSQLLKWGAVLTRGDAGKAEELVQEFCLYFAVTKPDLSGVVNLDGYLYTCLRHIYLSDLARSSREALRFISVAEFDSFDVALAANQSGDPLQRQNDLRRICSYAAWRKESAKSSSYFILHFFHGYARREIAELACVPISAIYNKLKIARDEIKAHLEGQEKLRILKLEGPPEPTLFWSLVSVSVLFKELRQTILQAKRSSCISEEELLASYRTPARQPISCSLLSHIVSCEKCLAIIDRYFRRPTLHDREPLDGFDSSMDISRSSPAGRGDANLMAMSQLVRKRWSKVLEHRPRTLSIAVNGKIIAFHDVQAEQNTLSARIEHPENAQFVEVFSEQDIRLAMLSIGELPPEGAHVRTQRVALSDDRWLELNLSFDGLGLIGEVAYFDPALAAEVVEDTEPSNAVWVPQSSRSTSVAPGIFTKVTDIFTRLFRPALPSSALAWAVMLVLMIGTAGYLAYRHGSVPIDASNALSQSVKIETASLQGQTEHQVIHVEEVSGDGRVLQQGAIDLWKDGDGRRYLRRLYDSRNRLIAAEWQNKDGKQSSHGRRAERNTSGRDHSLSMGGLWDQDLSAHAFSTLRGKVPQIHTVQDGYELTTAGPFEGRPRLISATLFLDHRFIPIRETMRIRAGSEIREIRFVQTSYERKPSASVPDTVFDPKGELQSSHALHSAMPEQGALPDIIGSNVRLARLQITVLSRLNSLHADTGEPIEVVRTSDGRIRVSGTVTDRSLKQQIVSALKTVEDHQLLELRLFSPHNVQMRPSDGPGVIPENTSIYEIGQAKPVVDMTLRKYFEAKGVSADRLDATVGQYSHDALLHAQRALQHAYALNRLGNALSATELKSIGPSSQRQWTEMVHNHATGLEDQLRMLHAQLADIAKPGDEASASGSFVPIEDPDQFKQIANRLLNQTENLNSNVGRLFTSNSFRKRQTTQNSTLNSTLNAIPLLQAEEISRFSSELKTAGGSASEDQRTKGDEKEVPKH
jgi:DNA-directed RNA polymerase specialized sigma subunit, sigma24 homolog